VTRYSFHHFPEPAVVFREMVRVCRPGGRVAVTDVFSSSPAQGAAYDAVEKLRDPSHVRALPLAELTELFVTAELTVVETAYYKLEVDLEDLLTATGTEPANAALVRQTFANDLGRDQLGTGAFERDGRIRFSFPVVIVAGTKL
jgi:SAM-dependent methyltransferase